MSAAQPVESAQRIETLDVIRGFALLGILLLNIISFALPSHLYFVPQDVQGGGPDLWVWAFIEITSEGAMRCLFSVLFGAGVALFLDPARGSMGKLHFRRTFWLLIFGVLDALVLLWLGDILMVYALSGFLLYTVRNLSARRLLIGAIALIGLMSAQYALMNFGLGMTRDAALEISTLEPAQQTAEQIELANTWQAFAAENNPSPEAIANELGQRNDSYGSAFTYGLEAFFELVTFVVPVILLWDALAMMLLGMALYKSGVLQGEKSASFYGTLAVLGFALGLVCNALEAHHSYSSGFELLATFPQFQWSYHIGRLGMAMGYMSLLVLMVRYDWLGALRRRLGAVGRMALTNYLSHSLIFMLIFSGAGLGWAGVFSRSEIYLFVISVWIFQLWFSPWWLVRYRYGPVEWLWRGLTYGRFPNMRIVAS